MPDTFSALLAPLSQARHLTDRTLLALAERQFGKVVARTVLYRGEDLEIPETGIRYRNVNAYLKSL